MNNVLLRQVKICILYFIMNDAFLSHFEVSSRKLYSDHDTLNTIQLISVIYVQVYILANIIIMYFYYNRGLK